MKLSYSKKTACCYLAILLANLCINGLLVLAVEANSRIVGKRIINGSMAGPQQYPFMAALQLFAGRTPSQNKQVQKAKPITRTRKYIFAAAMAKAIRVNNSAIKIPVEMINEKADEVLKRPNSYDGYRFKCAGVLIADQWVLTAYHCLPEYFNKSFADIDSRLFRVVLGNPYLANETTSKDQVIRNVSDVKFFNNSIDAGYIMAKSDIALVKLSSKVQTTPMIQFAKLPDQQKGEFPKKSICHAIGWGYDKFAGGNLNENLFSIAVALAGIEDFRDENIFSAFYHQELYKEMPKRIYWPGRLYAGSQKSGATFGDSGGPLLCKSDDDSGEQVVAGIVSSGFPGTPTAYTKVKPFLKWIHETIKG